LRGEGVSPWLLAGLLYLGSGLGLAVLQLARKAAGTALAEAPLRRTDLPWLALVVLSGGIIGPVLLMFGLATTAASTASLLLNLESLATMALARVIFGENVDGRLLAGAAAILAGAVLLSWQGGPERVDWGGLAIAGACLAWGLDNNLTRRLSAADPVQIALIKGLAAGAVNLVLALLAGAQLPSAAAISGAAVVGFVGYGVSLVLFVLGLRHLGAARTGAYFATAPFIGAVGAIALLGEGENHAKECRDRRRADGVSVLRRRRLLALGRSVRGGRHRFDLADGPPCQPAAVSGMHERHGGARGPHKAHQIRRQRLVAGDARRGARGAAMRDDRLSVERASADGLRHRP